MQVVDFGLYIFHLLLQLSHYREKLEVVFFLLNNLVCDFFSIQSFKTSFFWECMLQSFQVIKLFVVFKLEMIINCIKFFNYWIIFVPFTHLLQLCISLSLMMLKLLQYSIPVWVDLTDFINQFRHIVSLDAKLILKS